MNTVRILGVDPGSRVTGFGVVDASGQRLLYVDSGCIRTTSGAFNTRLEEIFRNVTKLIAMHEPDEVCFERVFMHRNADSALKLGHARAAALCGVFAHTRSQPPVLAEYSPREIKLAVAGYGAADKSQVQHMVCRLLALRSAVQSDAGDALAVALCHAHSRHAAALLEAAR